MATWDSMTLIKEDPEHHLVAKSFPQPNGLTGLMTKYISKKLKWEHLDELEKNMEHHMHTMNPNQTDIRLPDQGGYKCYLEKQKTPVFMSNRCSIQIHYRFKKADGTLVNIISTKGTEELRKQYAEQIGKDVVCDIPLGYSSYKEEADGMHCVMVVNFRMNGKVPNFFMNFAIRQSHAAAIMIEDYIVDGKIPKMM